MNPIEIEDQSGFRSAVHAAVDAALARGCRSLLFADADFSAWPLDDPTLLDALAGWLRRPGRRLTLLGQRFEHMEREHPRFTQWRPAWSHAIDARCPEEVPAGGLETLLLDDGPIVLTLWQSEPPRGRAASDATAAAAARDRIDAPLQRSAPAWPVRTLGL